MGNAVARLLWGDVSPSDKLPQTFPVSAADLPTAVAQQYPACSLTATRRARPELKIRQVYYVHRWYDNQGIQPLFPFGHGLSYTTFAYSHIQVTPRRVQSDNEIRVNFRVTNNGPVAGTEVAQVYLSVPGGLGEPPKRLVGWERVTLQPGEHANISVRIDPNSSAHPLSYWDTPQQRPLPTTPLWQAFFPRPADRHDRGLGKVDNVVLMQEFWLRGALYHPELLPTVVRRTARRDMLTCLIYIRWSETKRLNPW
jgi:hypothetical protein